MNESIIKNNVHLIILFFISNAILNLHKPTYKHLLVNLDLDVTENKNVQFSEILKPLLIL